jgi:N6-adenosine-specific RNA methylase IME4
MQKIRQALAAGEHGDQSRLEQMRCVDHSTVSTWKAACDLMDAIEGKCDLSHISEFQPTHARELTRALRRQHGKDVSTWPQEATERAVEWIERVEDQKLTVDAFKAALRQPATGDKVETCSVADLAALIDKGIRFRTIYGDPPWQYGNQATRAATDNHYRTMTTEQLAALPIAALAADDCQLHLWTTNGFLREALDLIAGWGFAYKSMLVWCKEEMGLGNYWRVSHELLLLGTKGSAPFRDRGLISWLREPRGRHSAKPEKVRHLVERAGWGPRLELFGRHLADGWVVWGDQIEKDLFHQAAEKEPDKSEPFEPTLFQEVESS